MHRIFVFFFSEIFGNVQNNIEYFLEHSSQKDCLVIAGHVNDRPIEDKRIYYVGDLNINHPADLQVAETSQNRHFFIKSDHIP